jgi:naphthoate synthase
MGVVNKVVPHAELESEGIAWAKEILGKSPTAIRMLKYAFNAVDDGLVGQQLFAGEATRLAYGTQEATEGKEAFLEKRKPDWSSYPWHF